MYALANSPEDLLREVCNATIARNITNNKRNREGLANAIEAYNAVPADQRAPYAHYEKYAFAGDLGGYINALAADGRL